MCEKQSLISQFVTVFLLFVTDSVTATEYYGSVEKGKGALTLQKKITGNEYRTTMLCVDSYDNSVLQGRFFNPYDKDGQSFTSASDFLVKMENMLDEMHFPEAFNAIRTFAPKTVTASEAGETTKSGKLATFAIRILFRQNASWQGSVTWLEGNADQSFRSFMELLLLIDGACKAK